MNSENSKIPDPHRLLLNLAGEINLTKSNKYAALSNLSICYTWKNIKKLYKNIKFKVSAPTRNDKFELFGGSYSVSDIQDYFGYVLKNHEQKTDNPSIKLNVNKKENKITFRIKAGYYLELLIPETMKLLRSTKSKTTKDKNGENVPRLEIIKVVSAHCNIVNNDNQHGLRILYTFVPKNSFGQLLDISPKAFMFLKKLNSEFLHI